MSTNNEGLPVFNAWLKQLSGTQRLEGLGGLLRATTRTFYHIPDGEFFEEIIEWKACANLKPGDVLYEGLLNEHVSNDHHWQLIRATGVRDIKGHLLLLSALHDICFTYSYRQAGAFRSHLNRLGQLANLARRLRLLVEEEPFMFLGLVTPEQHKGDALKEARETFCATLKRIETEIGRLANNPDRLRRLRGDENGRTAKSLERRHIWERTFELWTALASSASFMTRLASLLRNRPQLGRRSMTLTAEHVQRRAARGEALSLDSAPLPH